MNTFVRLMPVLFACVATQVVAGDPPIPKTVDPAKPVASAVAASSDNASAAVSSPEAKAPGMARSGSRQAGEAGTGRQNPDERRGEPVVRAGLPAPEGPRR